MIFLFSNILMYLNMICGLCQSNISPKHIGGRFLFIVTEGDATNVFEYVCLCSLVNFNMRSFVVSSKSLLK